MSSLMSSCHHLDVRIGEVLAPGLVDTGSMVSTLVESFFLKNFVPLGQDRRRICQWLQLRAANRHAIPYVDYIELDAELCAKSVSHCGILVVKVTSLHRLFTSPCPFYLHVIKWHSRPSPYKWATRCHMGMRHISL